MGNYTEERDAILPEWDAATLVKKANALQASTQKG